MDGEQLIRWRKNRNLTQDALAEMLGGQWTRDKVANMESGRTPIPDDIEPALAAIDAMLARQPHPNQQAKGQKRSRKEQWDSDTRNCWTLYGRPTTMQAIIAAAKKGDKFFRRDNSTLFDEVTNHPLANLYIWDYHHRTREFMPFCTHIDLDLATYEARCVKVMDKISMAFVDKLNNDILPSAKADFMEAQRIVKNNPSDFAMDHPTSTIFDPPA